MPETQSLRVLLEYPLEHVREPILYHLVTDYHLVPNIHRANVDVHTGGRLEILLQGETANVQAGIAFLRGLHIAVTELAPDSP